MPKLTLPTIPPLDTVAQLAATAHQRQLTKPPGSLGRLETLSLQLAGILGQARPFIARKGVIVMAADHGVTQEGVSAYPAVVTQQMVLNFLRGGAAVNVLARQVGAHITIVDVGVGASLPTHMKLVQRKVAPGTANMAQGPAMTTAQVEAAIQVGLDVIKIEIEKGLDVVAIGEMGIGNTTASSAIVAALTGYPVALVTGRGTGIDDTIWRHKVSVIEQALAVNEPDPLDPLDILTKVGGLEIAGLVGVVIGAAAQRIPVVIDGFISSVAALLAVELLPDVAPYLIASHRSVEVGHQFVLERLALQPLFDLDLRLGEGTGAVLAFHFLEAAVRILGEMATFAEAGVSDG